MSKKPVWAVAAVLERAGVPCAEEIAWMLRSRHTHTPGEAVTENLVEATETTDGSYDSVVYCTSCGAELSRETVVLKAGTLIGWNFNGVVLGALGGTWLNDTYQSLIIYDQFPEKTEYAEYRYALGRMKYPIYSTDEHAFTADYNHGQTYGCIMLPLDPEEHAWQWWLTSGPGMPLNESYRVLWTSHDICHKDTGEVTFRTYTPIPVYA